MLHKAVATEVEANRRLLPVNGMQAELLECINCNAVTIVEGATGSGKSTQVPKFLMNLPGCTVGMAEPRVVAAERLARRVAAERHEPLGENVGFATGEEWRLPEQTIDSCVVARIGIPTARECPLSN